MNLPTRTTLPTGSNPRSGFTFIEVMVTLVILSGAIVFIYKTFFLSVDYLSRLNGRLHASQLLDDKIADLAHLFRLHPGSPFDYGPLSVVQQINNKPVEFSYEIQLTPLAASDDLARLDVGIAWSQAGRGNRLSRSALLSL